MPIRDSYTVQETILQLIFDDTEIIYVMTLLYIMCICQKNTNLLHLQMIKIAYFIIYDSCYFEVDAVVLAGDGMGGVAAAMGQRAYPIAHLQ